MVNFLNYNFVKQLNMHKIDTRIIRFLDSDNKTVTSAYRVFQRSDGKKLVFYPVPKNANSSFKSSSLNFSQLKKITYF